jgi:hypothetical protein
MMDEQDLSFEEKLFGMTEDPFLSSTNANNHDDLKVLNEIKRNNKKRLEI